MNINEAAVGTAASRVVLRMPASLSSPAIAAFALSLLVLQLASGTDPVYSLLVFVFVVLASVAFNVCHGLTTIAGWCLSMMALKTIIISQVAKLFFWQPADSYLEMPRLTVAMFIVGLASLLVGVVIAGPARVRGAWLKPLTDPDALRIGAVVCAVVGGLSAALIMREGFEAAADASARSGLLGLAHILARALPMSIVFATAHTITRSDGRRSVSVLVVVTFGLALVVAAVQGTKLGVFETGLYYLLTCIAWQYSFRRNQLLALVLATLVAILVVWPLIQAVKDIVALRSITLSERVELMQEALSEIKSVDDFLETRDVITEGMSGERFRYYGRPTTVLDRFSLIEPADELVLATEEQGEVGWFPLVHAVRGLLPSFIDPEKPTTDTGNFFGHRIGFLHETDDQTQISFGIIPLSYAAFTWTGLLVIPALLMFLFLKSTGLLVDGFMYNVWTVYLFGRLQHYFVEQSISTMVREMLVLPLLLVCIAAAIRMVKEIRDARLASVA